MKIFNWVHRRFIHRDTCGQNVKKGDQILTSDTDTHALLENVVLADMLGGQRGGILSIGTFGHFDEQKECQFSQKDGEEFEEDEYSVEGESYMSDGEGEEDEELDPLVCQASNIDGQEVSNNVVFHDQTGLTPKANRIMTIDGNALRPSADAIDTEYCKMNKKERITLADLFSADADGNIKPADQGKRCRQLSKEPTLHERKNIGKLFPKKLIPLVKEDSRPVRKLQQLMKRMLKRKIHPDAAEGKIHKDSQTISCARELATNESVSLLQVQEATFEL